MARYRYRHYLSLRLVATIHILSVSNNLIAIHFNPLIFTAVTLLFTLTVSWVSFYLAIKKIANNVYSTLLFSFQSK